MVSHRDLDSDFAVEWIDDKGDRQLWLCPDYQTMLNFKVYHLTNTPPPMMTMKMRRRGARDWDVIGTTDGVQMNNTQKVDMESLQEKAYGILVTNLESYGLSDEVMETLMESVEEIVDLLTPSEFGGTYINTSINNIATQATVNTASTPITNGVTINGNYIVRAQP